MNRAQHSSVVQTGRAQVLDWLDRTLADLAAGYDPLPSGMFEVQPWRWR